MDIIIHGAVVAVFLTVVASSADARCPPQNWVRGPECREDYDCRKGICCPNWLGKKSCVYNYRHMLKNSNSNIENNEIDLLYVPDANSPDTENGEGNTIIKNTESNDIFKIQTRDNANRNVYTIENGEYLKKKQYNTIHYEVMNPKPFENDGSLEPSNTRLSHRVLPPNMNVLNKYNLNYINRIKENNQYEIRIGNKTHHTGYRTIYRIVNLEPVSNGIGSYRNTIPTSGRPRFARYQTSTNLKDGLGSGVYCNGVKCKPWQVCKPDKWGKLTCQ